MVVGEGSVGLNPSAGCCPFTEWTIIDRVVTNSQVLPLERGSGSRAPGGAGTDFF